MSKRSATPLLIVAAVLIAAAILIRYFGQPLMDLLVSLHGGGGGKGH
jgi:hypothetical protein